MKIETTIKYYEGFIPPRCRKMRYKEVFKSVWVNVLETTFDTLKLAYIDLWNDWEVYYYNGKYYKRKFFNLNCAYDNTITNALDDLIAWRKKGSQYFAKTKDNACDFTDYAKYETQNDIVKRLKKEMSQYLIVDGVLYEMVIGKPYYNIYTFGLGRNHGGTALFVSYSTSPKQIVKQSKGMSFCIADEDKAIETAIKIAINRGDTNYIDIIKKKKIDIKIPNLFK